AVTAANGGSAGPILLTKRKERKRTLPMDIGINADSPAPAKAAAPPAAVPDPETMPSDDEPRWLDADDEEDTAEWSDIDLDAGTRG
ncbi:MAG: hypothetical protein JWM82_2206, partial [Myxococcales bacterium]|nr:hypothetical protein [Myxococcales bacterium]